MVGRAIAFGPFPSRPFARGDRWLRGPRTVSELRVQEKLAVAAGALVHEAALWTLNPDDFSDVPGSKLP